MKHIFRLLLALASCLFFRPALAASLEVGDALPEITAKDQHGTTYTFTNGTAFLIVAIEMEGAKAANQKLADKTAGYLEKHNAVYLMDIHTMPGIARFFALPKMRKNPQRIILVENAETLNRIPVKPGHVTVLKLTPEGHVEKISYWQPANEPIVDVFK